MDNFRFDITSEGDIGRAMDLAFSKQHSAKGYCIRPASAEPKKPLRLVFFWAIPEGRSAADAAMQVAIQAFPFAMDAQGAADFATRWLAAAEYGREPDHDGDNERGWRLYNEGWGHVDGQWEAFAAVTPAWAMYGK